MGVYALLGLLIPKLPFITDLVAQIKVWDPFLILTIPLLLLKSGPKIWFGTIKTVRIGGKGVYRLQNSEILNCDYFFCLNQIMRPFFNNKYTSITIKKLSHIFIFTRNCISIHIARLRPKNDKKWYMQKSVKLAVYPAHVIHMCQKSL